MEGSSRPTGYRKVSPNSVSGVGTDDGCSMKKTNPTITDALSFLQDNIGECHKLVTTVNNILFYDGSPATIAECSDRKEPVTVRDHLEGYLSDTRELAQRIGYLRERLQEELGDSKILR